MYTVKWFIKYLIETFYLYVFQLLCISDRWLWISVLMMVQKITGLILNCKPTFSVMDIKHRKNDSSLEIKPSKDAVNWSLSQKKKTIINTDNMQTLSNTHTSRGYRSLTLSGSLRVWLQKMPSQIEIANSLRHADIFQLAAHKGQAPPSWRQKQREMVE